MVLQQQTYIIILTIGRIAKHEFGKH